MTDQTFLIPVAIIPLMNKKKITVVGGGTGTSVVLQGLKKYPDLELCAVVVVSDNGGSTGRLRDEFGFLPVGDLRQCLAALAHGDNEEDIRQLLLYRFSHGEGLKGHNLGNLILTGLSDIASSPGKAIEIASQIFAIEGKVLPVTESVVDLVIEYENGQVVIGESNLDDKNLGGKKITSIKLSPTSHIYQHAAQSIKESDLIVFGPGDLYGSLLPNACVTGFTEALQESKGKFVYVVNLMTHYSQTHGMTAADHVEEVVKYCKRQPDYIVMNNGIISPEILNLYENNQEYPVIDDLDSLTDGMVVHRDLISRVAVAQQSGDAVERSVLRHDVKELGQVLYQLL